jgi:thiamine-phosphate pyrophosphorylase
VKGKVSVPVVAIGGINEDNVAEVINAGADAVAVVSAVLGANDVKEASRRLTARIGGER